MKHVKEKMDKSGFIVSTKKPISKKQRKVMKLLSYHCVSFSPRYSQDFHTNLKVWWNGIPSEIRNRPDIIVMGMTSSTNFCGNSAGNISPSGVLTRSNEVYKLSKERIHQKHKLTVLEFIALANKKVIEGSGLSMFYRNNPTSWINLISGTTNATSIAKPWLNEEDWSSRQAELINFLQDKGNGVKTIVDSMSNLSGGRNMASYEIKNPLTLSLRGRYEAIQDKISNVPPIYWNRQLNEFERKLALRQKPEGSCVGIELEFVCHNNSAIKDWDCEDYPTCRYLSFTTDGSISTDNSDEAVARYQELKGFINIHNPSDWEKVRTMMTTLTDNGAIINKFCGCHIHIDMRDRPQATYYRIAGRVRTAFTSWMHRLVSPRRAQNRYCGVWMDSSSSRYSAINTHCWNEHRTIEVRVGMPTLNPSKLRFWATLLHWVVNNSTKIDTLEDFMNSHCPLELKVYVIERINRFNPLWETTLRTSHSSVIPKTEESLQGWDKWVKALDAIKHTGHDFGFHTNDW